MLSIPFLNGKRTSAKENEIKTPDWDVLLSDISKALADNAPDKAYSLVSPWLKHDEAPARFHKAAGHALTSVGKHQDSICEFEKYLTVYPDSVKGLLAAGLASAKARDLQTATGYFNRAIRAITGRARTLLEPLISRDIFDAVAIEDLVYEVESNPGDKERVLALVLALGRAGHFKAVEKFMPAIE
jgi:tetratricopeptide (TPR) repeat protein